MILSNTISPQYIVELVKACCCIWKAKGYPVYLIAHTGELDKLSKEHFENLEMKYKGKKVFILIDYIHINVIVEMFGEG